MTIESVGFGLVAGAIIWFCAFIVISLNSIIRLLAAINAKLAHFMPEDRSDY